MVITEYVVLKISKGDQEVTAEYAIDNDGYTDLVATSSRTIQGNMSKKDTTDLESILTEIKNRIGTKVK